jgi:hypothetical protein
MSWRRVIALACMACVLFAGFAHNLHHHDGATTGSVAQFDSASLDAPPDQDNDTPAPNEHCIGCVLLAVPDHTPSTLPLHGAMKLMPPLAERTRGHTALTDPPIPIIAV